MDSALSTTLSREPPRELSLSMFPYTQSFVSSDPGQDALADAYTSFFWGPYKAEFVDAGSGVTGLRVRYQSIPIHAAGVATSVITNALLRLATNSSLHAITTTNYPLPPNKEFQSATTTTTGSSEVYGMLMPLALALLSASFLVFPLQERETKAKQVQVMTGAPLWGLWLATFLWDYLTYLLSALAIFAAFMIGDSQKYFTVDAAPAALVLLLLLYGWGSIPLAYVFSFFFQTAAAGFAVLTLISIVAGMIITTAVWALELSKQPDLLIVSDVLKWITSFLPAYPSSMGFEHMVSTSVYNAQCDLFNETLTEELCNNIYFLQPPPAFVVCCLTKNSVSGTLALLKVTKNSVSGTLALLKVTKNSVSGTLALLKVTKNSVSGTLALLKVTKNSVSGTLALLKVTKNSVSGTLALHKVTKNSVSGTLALLTHSLSSSAKCADVGDKICFQKRSYFAFDNDGMGPDLLTLAVNGVIFFLLLILIESGLFTKLRVMLLGLCRRKATSSGAEMPPDDDVVAEAALVGNLLAGVPTDPPTSNPSLLVDGLSKTFMGASRPAVNGISFHVGRGECFGLLGVNGAGKTTTFRMLTGDEVPGGGDARIGGHVPQSSHQEIHTRDWLLSSIRRRSRGAYRRGNADLLGRLRGISDRSLLHSVKKLVTLVGLTECAQRPSATYSGGNRRKLSTAMALIGEPPLVFLDEPTSGVDPASRRRVWAAISQAVRGGQSVVLTSHSMEECEALCSRITIMARGALRCIGSSGHLKAKFGQGYSLQVKLRTHDPRQEDEQQYAARVSHLKTTIQQRLAATLTDQHKGAKPSVVGRHFSVMEAMKRGQGSPSGEGSDAVTQNEGSDAVTQNEGSDAVTQNAGSDAVTQNAGSDAVTQNEGSDAVTQNEGSDAVTQNEGSDAVTQNAGSDAVTQNAEEGSDAVTQNEGSDAVTQNPLVEDYSASDTSLEQVFLSFAREAAAADPGSPEIPSEIVIKL
ncbi:ATP-binding cassette sub-family A member 3 [Chionoecetes opilio]|uniref:ATP-binding cassette sub-family A member 3 n=1 Tax=Chionoecetes opilio TaxID=41210 RepID=A0A8J5D3R6_CHIOP|nr:ATP-binding cassette sub-family A member 3 [Chionoecetes opilio]